AAALAGAHLAARPRRSRAALACAAAPFAALLLLSPYLVFNWRTAGSAFAPMKSHARFWRNHEFAGRPGFPTRAEVIANGYTGPEITPAGYVFGLHGAGEVCARYGAGYWLAFTRYLPALLGPLGVLAWLIPLGAAAALRRRAVGALLVAAALGAVLPNAFILPLDTVLTPEVPAVGPGVELRFTFPLLPYGILWIAMACAAAAERFRRERPGTPSPEGSAGAA
ncbi:MAG: hypothetical protein HZA54_14605, partial [Planctomycetes bacterium]|nr:hypothetical protein [Planctomycetota bacterium]